MVFVVPVLFLAPIYAITIATVGTDYLKWFFAGIDYDKDDVAHKKRDERDKVIGLTILIIEVIIILCILI